MPEINKIKTVLPPITKAEFKGFGSENDKVASSWGWTNLKRYVCPIMRSYFVDHQAGEWTDFGLGEGMKDDIFGRYGLLNRHEAGKALHTWATLCTVNPALVILGDRPTNPPIDHHFIYIPMGWARNAIHAAEQGIVRVTFEMTIPGDTEKRIPPLGVLIAHTALGKKLEVLHDGCHPPGFRYVEPSRPIREALRI